MKGDLQVRGRAHWKEVDDAPNSLCVELEIILWMVGSDFGSRVSGKRLSQICVENL